MDSQLLDSVEDTKVGPQIHTKSKKGKNNIDASGESIDGIEAPRKKKSKKLEHTATSGVAIVPSTLNQATEAESYEVQGKVVESPMKKKKPKSSKDISSSNDINPIAVMHAQHTPQIEAPSESGSQRKKKALRDISSVDASKVEHTESADSKVLTNMEQKKEKKEKKKRRYLADDGDLVVNGSPIDSVNGSDVYGADALRKKKKKAAKESGLSNIVI